MNTKEQLITLLLGELNADNRSTSPTTELSENRLLLFTEKEIMKMPKYFRGSFRAQGCTAHYRLRADGRYRKSYEIRYAKKPFDKSPISVSAQTLAEAKRKFIDRLNSTSLQDNGIPTIPKKFGEFAIYWFENFYKRKVCAETFKKNFARFEKLIKPILGSCAIKDITALAIQSILDALSNRHRLEEDVYSMLNQIFSCAVKHGVINVNPVCMVFHKNSEREHGKALGKSEEIELLNAFKVPVKTVFAVLLYTGLRPNEYATATIDGEFLKSKNSKRKNGKIECKRIPITPMLHPFLNGLDVLPPINFKTLDKKFKEVLPTHKLYDLRTTFQTRCSECGIPDNVIGVWMGNSIGKLKDAYTDYSDEYLLNQAEKLKY